VYPCAMILRRLISIIWLAVAAGAAMAGPVAELQHTRVELLVDSDRPQAGRPLAVGIALRPRPGWHTYWEQPGDSGMPTRAQWRLPPGVTATPLRYPTPEAFLVAGIMNHVYGREAVLLSALQLPAGLNGRVPIAVKLDWLVCDERLCVPETADLDLVLDVVADGGGQPRLPDHNRLIAAEQALPRAPTAAARFELVDGRLRLLVPQADAQQAVDAHFFPLADDQILFAQPQRIGQSSDGLVIDTAAVHGAAPAIVRGVARIVRADGAAVGVAIAATPGPVPHGTPLHSAGAPGFGPAFGWALLGGLLLNLMPCVFPILSLKALSLARAGQSESHARIEGLAYTAGVMLVCVALGAVVVAGAHAGAGAGWAFQLQDPRIILLLLLLTLGIGLNFLGLFNVGRAPPRGAARLVGRPGASGAFWTGALAAVIATPCTGPFMAAALGAALLLPPLAGVAVFAGLGAGIALPFLLLGFVPWLRRRLPKPGRWMETLRRLLGIPMLLTAAALLWVLGRQAGGPGLLIGSAAAAMTAAALFWTGWRQASRRSPLLPAAVVAAIAATAAVGVGRLPAPERSGAPELAGAVRFSPDRLTQLRAARLPVFLYFTADWCLTCKINERGALASADVAKAFRQSGIVTMVGDWTTPDPEIARFLADHRRAGIPFYLFYDRTGAVTELPQLLTTERLLALASAAETGEAR